MGSISGMGFAQAQVHTNHSTSAEGTSAVMYARVLVQNPFSNSSINKVAMVKKALLPMSLYSLLWVNEIIRCHLHIVDMNDAI